MEAITHQEGRVLELGRAVARIGLQHDLIRQGHDKRARVPQHHDVKVHREDIDAATQQRGEYRVARGVYQEEIVRGELVCSHSDTQTWLSKEAPQELVDAKM